MGIKQIKKKVKEKEKMKIIFNMFLLYKEKKTKIKEKDDNNFNRESGYMFIHSFPIIIKHSIE